MLKIVVPGTRESELWDEKASKFITVPAAPEQTLQLEHSLVSLQLWESKWCKPFLTKEDKTNEEVLDYIRCMTLTPDVDSHVYSRLTNENLAEINAYINSPMTATTISESKNGKKNREIVTTELIYYWMISLNIPFECKTWHLNQLLMLIRVCNVKNEPPKKRSKQDIMNQYEAINKANREKFKSRG